MLPIPSTEEAAHPGSDEDISPVTGSSAPEISDIPVINESAIKSHLTGLPTTLENITKRPAAIMINNDKRCLPQIGISNASIIFECNIEGGENRLIGIFEDYEELDHTGPVRSSRPYFIDIAQMHDAIYVHAGGSADAYQDLKDRHIDNIDGVNDGKTWQLGVFWRDPVKQKERGYEHALMVNGEGLVRFINYKEYRTEHRDNYKPTYNFKDKNSDIDDSLSPNKAFNITIPHSQTVTSSFEYSESDMKYYHSQYNRKHIDERTGEQLSFENVLVVFTDRRTYDDYGRLEVNITGTGTGYYASRGEYIPITWKRADKDSIIEYFTKDGKPLYLNPGKTFISMASTGIEKSVKFS
ncbi:MAG: DUF3048 domain-containing protein [Ruminococcaceae bacterium]|nr:DUF3048 domain-containing protein [Oscillospiraceae bacterium]